MATTKSDLFHDDLHALMRKYGFDVGPDGTPIACAFYDLHEEVEKALEAQGPALSCDHCGSLVTKLNLVRGENIAVCAQCRDGLTPPVDEAALEERADPENGPDEGAFNRWANRGLGRG